MGVSFTSSIRSPGCSRPSLTAAPLCRMFLTRMGPGPWTVLSLVTTVKPRPSVPAGKQSGIPHGKLLRNSSPLNARLNYTRYHFLIEFSPLLATRLTSDSPSLNPL